MQVMQMPSTRKVLVVAKNLRDPPRDLVGRQEQGLRSIQTRVKVFLMILLQGCTWKYA